MQILRENKFHYLLIAKVGAKVENNLRIDTECIAVELSDTGRNLLNVYFSSFFSFLARILSFQRGPADK